jgi:hypothetical protein
MDKHSGLAGNAFVAQNRWQKRTRGAAERGDAADYP